MKKLVILFYLLSTYSIINAMHHVKGAANKQDNQLERLLTTNPNNPTSTQQQQQSITSNPVSNSINKLNASQKINHSPDKVITLKDLINKNKQSKL